MLAWGVTKPSGARGPYLSCQSGNSPRGGPGLLLPFCSLLAPGTGLSTQQKPHKAFKIKKPRIRNSGGFQSREARKRERMVRGKGQDWRRRRKSRLSPAHGEEHALKMPRAQWGLLTHNTNENRRELRSKAFGEAGIFCVPKLQKSLVFLPLFCFSHDSAAYVCPSLLPLATA